MSCSLVLELPPPPPTIRIKVIHFIHSFILSEAQVQRSL